MSGTFVILDEGASVMERINAEVERINEGIDNLLRMRGLTEESKIAKLHFFADLIQGYVVFHRNHGWTKADQPGRNEEYLPYTHAIGELVRGHL